MAGWVVVGEPGCQALPLGPCFSADSQHGPLSHGCRGFSNMAVGLRPDVDIFEGAACEFVLGLLLAFTISYSGELKSR